MTHTTAQFRGPALVGDVTYVRGTVSSPQVRKPGQGTVTVDYVVSSQRDEIIAKGIGEVLLPLE